MPKKTTHHHTNINSDSMIFPFIPNEFSVSELTLCQAHPTLARLHYKTRVYACMYVCMYASLLVAIYQKFKLNERI